MIGKDTTDICKQWSQELHHVNPCSKNVINRIAGLMVRVLIVVVVAFFLNSWFTYEKDYMKTNDKINSSGESEECFGCTTYDWFISLRKRFLDMGKTERVVYPRKTPVCRLNISGLGSIKVNKSEVSFEWLEEQFLTVRAGGYYAPAHCRPRHHVAILIAFRDREKNLAILLRHLHPTLQRQMIEYKIFVIEQDGLEKFNKGILYNAGYLESLRFGRWNCLIFHDVDLIPMSEKILYFCPRKPAHMSSAVESHEFVLLYKSLIGGVFSMAPRYYEAVNGYSNLYWNWGGEDDDMYIRLQAKKLSIMRYNASLARYATLPHKPSVTNTKRFYILGKTKTQFRKEGLNTVVYRLITITMRKLFTHIVIDANPKNLITV